MYNEMNVYEDLLCPKENSEELANSPEDQLGTVTTLNAEDFFTNSAFLIKLPSNIDILSVWREKITEISTDERKNTIVNILFKFQQLVLAQRVFLEQQGITLPALEYSCCDNVIAIEWNFKEMRMGILVDRVADKSKWYMASNQNGSLMNLSGPFVLSDSDTIISNIFSLAIDNA